MRKRAEGTAQAPLEGQVVVAAAVADGGKNLVSQYHRSILAQYKIPLVRSKDV